MLSAGWSQRTERVAVQERGAEEVVEGLGPAQCGGEDRNDQRYPADLSRLGEIITGEIYQRSPAASSRWASRLTVRNSELWRLTKQRPVILQVFSQDSPTVGHTNIICGISITFAQNWT